MYVMASQTPFLFYKFQFIFQLFIQIYFDNKKFLRSLKFFIYNKFTTKFLRVKIT